MAAEAYATVDEYRTDTGDESTPDDRVRAMLDQQSAKLRALAGISPSRTLTEDQALLARSLVTDASRKALVPVTLEGLGDVTGATQGSFSANGFQASVQLSNPSGTAYFDRSTLAALRASLGTSQAIGTVRPSYGRPGC